MKHIPFDEIHIRQFETSPEKSLSMDESVDHWGLIGIKRMEYLKRVLDMDVLNGIPEPLLDYFYRFLGRYPLKIAIETLLQRVARHKCPKFDTIKKCQNWMKEMHELRCTAHEAPSWFERSNIAYAWKQFDELWNSKDMRNAVGSIGYHKLRVDTFRLSLFKVRFRRMPLPKFREDDELLQRMRKLRTDLRLDEQSLEILLACHLIKIDTSFQELHNQIITAKGLQSCSSLEVHPICLSVMTGIPFPEVSERISGDGGLEDIGLIAADGSLCEELSKYLSGLISGGMTSIYGKVDCQPAMPMERFNHIRELPILMQMLAGHKPNRPLHILFHGTEGTGKSELARTLAHAVNRPLIEVGRDLESSLPKNGQRQSDSITEFRLRALRITESLEREHNVVLVVDEADHLLNMAEKGVLNQYMEQTRTPIIWITNSISWVEKSTLRRFDINVEFHIAASDARMELWRSVVEKHKAQEIFPEERCMALATRYETSTGGIDLAVRNELSLNMSGNKTPIAENILQRHAELLSLKTHQNYESRSPRYDATCLNLSHDRESILRAATSYANQLHKKETESNLTLLLYGPPGTGKTEFARYLARECKLPFEEISYARITSKYVGESEKQLRRVFHQASETGALLFIDEADSLVGDRTTARMSWEISLVNEFLIQLESCKCMVVCSTNFQNHLDAASRRRFHFHLEFGYLQADGVRKMVEAFFPAIVQHPCFNATDLDALKPLQMLTPGDFFSIHQRLRWLDPQEITLRLLYEELRKEEAAKSPYGQRKMGL